MIVIVNKLNRRKAPVNDTADKTNIAGTVSKGFSFDSIYQTTIASGSWHRDSAGFFYWGGGLSPATPSTVQPMPKPTPVVVEGDLTNFTSRQIQLATGASQEHARLFMPYLNSTCGRYAINTPVRALCFFSQVGEESARLFYTEEIASGADYEGRMGNIHPGDGVRYKGRGLIQITGRDNYSAISRDLGIDFLSFPSLLGAKNTDQCSEEQLKFTALSAGWYWNNRKINSIADRINLRVHIESEENKKYFTEITRAINGGINGLETRILNYQSGLQSFL